MIFSIILLAIFVAVFAGAAVEASENRSAGLCMTWTILCAFSIIV